MPHQNRKNHGFSAAPAATVTKLCIKNKSEIISACNEALDALCDQTEIEEEIARLNEECAVTAELISKCVEESAHAAICPERFEERYAVLADRYQTAKEKLTEYESRLHERIAKRESTRQFLKQLTNKSLVTEFDKDLWNAVVDRVVVYSFDKVVFEFKDGTAVEQKIK